MKRATLLLLFILAAGTARAQPPAAFANTHRYTTLPDFNYGRFQLAPSGRIYAAPYGAGTTEIRTPFQSTTVNVVNHIPGAVFSFAEKGHDSAWMTDGRTLYILKCGDITNSVPAPGAGPHRSISFAGGRAFCQQGLDASQAFYALWEYDGAGFIPIPSGALRGQRIRIATATGGAVILISDAGNPKVFYSLPRGTVPRLLSRVRIADAFADWGVVAFADTAHFVLWKPSGKGYAFCQRGRIAAVKQSEVVNQFHALHGTALRVAERIATSAYRIRNFTDTTEPPVFFEERDHIAGNFFHEPAYRTFLYTTGNKPARLFPWITHYPRIFDGEASASIFTIRADAQGRVWAGAYSGGLAVVSKDAATQLPHTGIRWTNGGSFYNGRMYLISEGARGLVKFDAEGRRLPMPPTGATGFYTLVSRDGRMLYYGTADRRGLWACSTASLEDGKPRWTAHDSGTVLENILTIAEDTAGRIWYAHPKSGIGVYNSRTGGAHSWSMEEGSVPFGAMASITDGWGTVWMGGPQGLWHYADYRKQPIPESFTQLHHPLIDGSKRISAMGISGDWLILSAYDKVLALYLPSFHQRGRIILRYLNPQEAGLTSFTEQNTIAVTPDSAVWFSTSDMLYRWDFPRWLQLPMYPSKVEVRAGQDMNAGDSAAVTLKPGETFSIGPHQTSFDIHLDLLSPDAMPRYVRAGLIRDGDTAGLPPPGLQGAYSFRNIAAGRYRFVVEIFEQDGTMIRYEYPVRIRPYFWKTGWFWGLCSLAVIGVVAAVMRAEHRRKTAYTEQEKILADLRLVSLSNQFRPHFILNALNTIGSRMDGDPEMESVLSRLGESINLIFSHAQDGKVLHTFSREWALVESVIAIQQAMYLRGLEARLPEAGVLQRVKDAQLPLGMIQIPVENALMHGLRNRDGGPWLLEISVREEATQVVVAVTDNGVGRVRAAELSASRKHGAGTKNLSAILTIINAGAAGKGGWRIEYEDGIFSAADGETYGTRCILTLPKSSGYGNSSDRTDTQA